MPDKTDSYHLYRKPFQNTVLWTAVFVALAGFLRFGHLARDFTGLVFLVSAELLPLVAVFALVRKERRADLGLKGFHIAWWFISIGSGLFLGSALALFARFFLPPSWDWIVAMGRSVVPQGLRSLPWVLIDSAFILIGGIITPLSEELFFRGMAIAGWGKGAPARGSASLVVIVVAQALVFGFFHLAHTGIELFPYFAVHLPRALNIFASTFIGGIIFAMIRIRSGSVWPAVLAHVSVNAAAALL